MKIFYSWQSDLPNASNRGFIEKALENVSDKLKKDKAIEIEPSLDRDTAGVPGSPEIVATILKKIEDADFVICDITIINGAHADRPSPNPNVVFEVGYALRALGSERVLLVLNTEFGAVEKLPFDLRPRRILQYSMAAEAADRATERKKLENSLLEAIRAIKPRRGLSPPYKIAFANESEEVRNLAFEQPPLWEYLLTIELLRPKILNIRRDYDAISNGLIFTKSTKVTSKEYFRIIQEKISDAKKILHVLNVALYEIQVGWGEPGISGDALEIKKAADKYVSICEAILGWETDLVSVDPPEIFQNMKKILVGTTAQMFPQVERLANEMQRVFEQENPSGEHNIVLEIKIPDGWSEATQKEFDRVEAYFAQNSGDWDNYW